MTRWSALWPHMYTCCSDRSNHKNVPRTRQSASPATFHILPFSSSYWLWSTDVLMWSCASEPRKTDLEPETSRGTCSVTARAERQVVDSPAAFWDMCYPNTVPTVPFHVIYGCKRWSRPLSDEIAILVIKMLVMTIKDGLCSLMWTMKCYLLTVGHSRGLSVFSNTIKTWSVCALNCRHKQKPSAVRKYQR